MLAASVFAAIAISGLVFFDDLMVMAQADIRTPAGRQLRAELPDRSVALLNTDSAIAIDFTAKERRVRVLKGEVFFEVRKAGVPFRAETSHGTVEAIGTAFAVRTMDGALTVTVSEGKVAVNTRHADPNASEPAAVLEAGKQLSVTATSGPKSAVPKKVDVGKSLAWRAGKIAFEATPFADAVAELDRYLPGRIFVLGETAAGSPITGIVHTDQLIPGIRAIAEVQGLSVTQFPGGVLILH
jgi:transmembrane sensor